MLSSSNSNSTKKIQGPHPWKLSFWKVRWQSGEGRGGILSLSFSVGINREVQDTLGALGFYAGFLHFWWKRDRSLWNWHLYFALQIQSHRFMLWGCFIYKMFWLCHIAMIQKNRQMSLKASFSLRCKHLWVAAGHSLQIERQPGTEALSVKGSFISALWYKEALPSM